LRERKDDPVVNALSDVVRDVWSVRETESSQAAA